MTNHIPKRPAVMLACAMIVATAMVLAHAVPGMLPGSNTDAPDRPTADMLSRLEADTITRVVDGDTLVIGTTTVRLALVNTPERGEPGYAEARGFTASQCPISSQAIYVVDAGQPGGSHGRQVAKVWCAGDGTQPMHSLNSLLVESGHAEVLGRFCDASEFSNDPWARAC